MFANIDPRSPTPLYAQIASRLRVAIASGELANVVSAWLEGREIVDDPDQPGDARVFPIPRD